ncbi:hypothetical protein [uncultured Lacinutrix sp.]|uniref:hypothetical protein n=1 Tax=uncultured Lacinutrix sp. TaxID=574032 RepID=UPI00260219D5|nr:hypothetical protein [uncultured Lacinutrix sp.]
MTIFKNTLFVLFIISIISSCSSNDPDQTITPQITGDYFPSELDNYWRYSPSNSGTIPSNYIIIHPLESIFISNSEASIINVNSNETILHGVVNKLLTSGDLKKTESTLHLNGKIDPPRHMQNMFLGLEIPLNDFALYDLNADINSELSVVSSTLTQNNFTANFTIDYTITSKVTDVLESTTINGELLNNVLISEITMNLSIKTPHPDGSGDIEVLAPQDTMVITSYFLKDLGLYISSALIEYQINPDTISILEDNGFLISSIISTEVYEINGQSLNDYMVNE